MADIAGAANRPFPAYRIGPRKHAARARPGVWLAEAERLFADFKELTPYPYRPFVRSFSSFAEYERWKRAQKNPWYR